MPGWVEFAGKFHGSTKRSNSSVRHFYSSEHSSSRYAKVKIGEHLGSRSSVHNGKFLFWHIVHIESSWPCFHVDDVVSFLKIGKVTIIITA